MIESFAERTFVKYYALSKRMMFEWHWMLRLGYSVEVAILGMEWITEQSGESLAEVSQVDILNALHIDHSLDSMFNINDNEMI